MTYSNPCADASSPDSCIDRWTASASIPREFLPFQVTRWNAYAIHAEPWGDESPSAIYYESLFPTDQLSAPDFHYLEAFGDIDLEGDVGYVQSESQSDTWEQANTLQDYTFRHAINMRNHPNLFCATYLLRADTTLP